MYMMRESRKIAFRWTAMLENEMPMPVPVPMRMRMQM